MTFSVLLPYREDSHERKQNYEYVVDRWNRLGVEVITSRMRSEGPFQLPKLLNRAFKASSGDNILMYGVDHLPPDAEFLRGVEYHLKCHPWMPLYGKTLELEALPSSLIRVGGLKPSTDLSGLLIGQCTGVLAMTRAAFKATGGSDERFSGWGWEDAALRLTLERIFKNVWREPSTTLIGLWHPQQPRDMTRTNESLFREYESAPDIHEYLAQRGSFL